MRRWWVTLALLLSLGINVGLLAAVAAGRWADRRQAAADPPPLALPGGGRELPGERSVEVPREDRGAAAGEAAVEVAAVAGEPGAAARRSAGRRGADEGSRRAGRPGADVPAREPPLGRLADHLGLAGERRERFVALQREFIGSHLEGRRERTRLRTELRRELMAPQPDRARIEGLLARLGEASLASERAAAEVILRSRELLDADQQEAYSRFLDHLRDGHPADGHGPGGRHRHR